MSPVLIKLELVLVDVPRNVRKHILRLILVFWAVWGFFRPRGPPQDPSSCAY